MSAKCECGHALDLHNKNGCRAAIKWTSPGGHIPGDRSNWAAQPLAYCKCIHAGESEEHEIRAAILGLAGSVTAATDQAQAMTNAELGAPLLNGRWTTIEVHEAGRRLLAGGAEPRA